jgi:hypothetical protein
MKKIIVPIVLSICLSANAQTLIYPVGDLLMSIPTFTNSPNFDLWMGMYGQMPVSNSMPAGERKKMEKELIDLIWQEVPEAKSISIWNGNVIIKI